MAVSVRKRAQTARLELTGTAHLNRRAESRFSYSILKHRPAHAVQVDKQAPVKTTDAHGPWALVVSRHPRRRCGVSVISSVPCYLHITCRKLDGCLCLIHTTPPPAGFGDPIPRCDAPRRAASATGAILTCGPHSWLNGSVHDGGIRSVRSPPRRPRLLATPIATPLQGGRPERPGLLFLTLLGPAVRPFVS